MKKEIAVKKVSKEINKNKKMIIIHGSILAIVLAFGIVGYIRFWNVATVNGKGISRVSYIKTLEQQGGTQILSSMIDETLILNEGIKNNVNVDQKTIDEEIAKIEEQLKAQNQTLDAALLSSGMTRADLDKQIKIKKIEAALSTTKVEITQAQIDEFLTTNKALLPTGKTKTELETLAKEQITLEANQTAATTWLANLKQNAKIVYK